MKNLFLSFVALLVLETSAFAGGVACRNLCAGSNDLIGCCQVCAQTCDKCLPCALDTQYGHGGSNLCSEDSWAKDCRNLPQGSPCEAMGLLGGKMNGECEFRDTTGVCTCAPIF